jgi:hypothetical protein
VTDLSLFGVEPSTCVMRKPPDLVWGLSFVMPIFDQPKLFVISNFSMSVSL